jgi:CDGSH-type Zn-finger protein
MDSSEKDEQAALIIPYQDGPLIIRGNFQIRGQDGTAIPAGRKVVALCRCGWSALKPFCDGSHARTGFRAGGGREAEEACSPEK